MIKLILSKWLLPKGYHISKNAVKGQKRPRVAVYEKKDTGYCPELGKDGTCRLPERVCDKWEVWRNSDPIHSTIQASWFCKQPALYRESK